MAHGRSSSENLAQRYATALRSCVDAEGAGSLAQAADLGHTARDANMGTLDLARVHESALAEIGLSFRSGQEQSLESGRADGFFAAAVAPIEASHGFAGAALRACETERDALMTENRRGVERVRESEELRRDQARHFLARLDGERRRISRDLHDALGQTLTGAHIALAKLAEDAAASSKDLRDNVTQTRRLVQRSMKTVHRFATRLHPAALDDLGLMPALRSLTNDVARSTRLDVRLTCHDDVADLETERRTAIYMVVQEALMNVRRHARARSVVVSVRRLPHALLVEVEDDGRSFDPRAVRQKRGPRLGLVCMRERMEMIGGTLTIESSPGKGTLIRAELPFSAGDRA